MKLAWQSVKDKFGIQNNFEEFSKYIGLPFDVILKNLNIIDYKTPLNLSLFEIRFKLINSFYFFSHINDFLFDIFKFITVSPVIRLKQIIALILRKDYRTYVLKKLRIIK